MTISSTTPTHQTVPPPSLEMLERNLRAIAARSPRAARAIAHAQPAEHLTFDIAPDGALICDHQGRSLASRRRPLEEAQRFAEGVDLHNHAGVLVLGFGLGHHVRALVERAKTAACIVVFEPDVALLRSVLERIDCTAWLGAHTTVLITDADNAGAMSQTLRGLEAPLSVGVTICEHPASKPRLTDSARTFLDTFTTVFSAMRTHVITTLMQTDVTVRNELMNAEHAIKRPGIADLENIAAGHPAIVVSAGPSLRRNIQLLKTPGLRDRCIIIAVQTVLKQLLAEGIRPHFVTAIDYHEISRRFYEGLTPEQVRGVTLVAEARANPAILDAFPADLRVPADDFLDMLFDDQPEQRGKLQPGATVAHLSYYLARYLGADPVILVGQDLAFTDGQYYPKGAAIHEVWAPELNAFNTLEMMEWQRIVRMRGTLRRATDHLGRSVFTDEQMATYLAQFERDFLPDTERGLTIIDATEGGIAKQHTRTMTLREAIEHYAGPGTRTLPDIPPAPPTSDDRRIADARDRMRRIALDVRRIARLSRETIDLMRKIEKNPRDIAKVNRLIDQINDLRDEVHAITPAWPMVIRLNQMGALKRFKADRLLELEPGMDQFERLERQTARDIQNLRWTAEYADLLAELIEIGEAAFDGAPKRTHDSIVPDLDEDARVQSRPRVRTGAFVLAQGDEPEVAGIPALRRTVARLLHCDEIESIIVLAQSPDRARHQLADLAERTTIEAWTPTQGIHRERIRIARAWADTCWRAGLGGATVFDEIYDAPALHEAMRRHALEGALVVGADWVCLDPAMNQAIVARFAEHPEANPVVFSQAPPGLAGFVIGRDLCEELASGVRDANRHATIGAVLGYHPARALSDPIAKTGCIQIPAPVRSTLFRFIADTPESTAILARVLSDLGEGVTDALSTCAALQDHASQLWPRSPRELTLELTTQRRINLSLGALGGRIAREQRHMETHLARAIIDAFASASPSGLLTIAGAGDPLCHPDWPELIRASREAGCAAIHLRTDLARDDDVARLLETPPDVVSVDVYANSGEVYAAITGGADFQALLDRMQRFIQAAGEQGAPLWIVPRLTRCDATYSEIEHFFDAWTAIAGCAIIDQRTDSEHSDRIEALGRPRQVLHRDARRRLTILADGAIPIDEHALAQGECLSGLDLDDAWTAIVERRRHAIEQGHWDDPSLRMGW